MKSLRAAINAMCASCIYDPMSPGTRAVQIALCTAPHCPLYEVRPMTATVIPMKVLEDQRLTREQVDPRILPLIREDHAETQTL